ncbi:MAG: histidinol-phosphate transaminase [Alphaproteobacteria bacterium]|nr:histidinol-phosphate transaminase [Alphaproteobacteria bacterium]
MSGPRPIAPRPGILEIEPYQGGLSDLEGRSDVIKLSSNEGALGPSPKAMAAFEAAADDLGRYPDGACSALRAAIGARFGLDPERIVCGAGSDELLGLLARAYAGEGDEVLYSEHGFLIYPIAAMAVGAAPVKVAEIGLKADVDGFIGRAGNRTRLVYIANPNNPTGSYLSADELRRLRAGLPEGVVLVIDAAYAEYVTEADYEAGVALVDEGENTVMTRTFSKIFGLGGLRLGWAYGPPHVIDVLNRLRMPFNVSSAAQAAGIAALADRDHTEAAIAHNTDERARLAAALAAAGLEVPPSAGNFVLARFPGGARQAEAADRHLKSQGIIVRRMGAYGLPDSLRITVGLHDEMTAAAAALTEFMASEEGGDG